MTCPRFLRLIRLRVLPVTEVPIWDAYSGVSVYTTKNSGRMVSFNRTMLQSTAVIVFPNPSGITQARPTGSGSLETRISLGKTSVQCRRSKVASSMNLARSPLSKYTPYSDIACLNKANASIRLILTFNPVTICE